MSKKLMPRRKASSTASTHTASSMSCESEEAGGRVVEVHECSKKRGHALLNQFVNSCAQGIKSHAENAAQRRAPKAQH